MKMLSVLSAPGLAVCMLSCPSLAVTDNVHITGRLVLEACSLSPDSADIPLDFGSLVAKPFYEAPHRTPGMSFNIRLIHCDITVGKQATVTFSGKESGGLPGLLAPDAGDTRGIAFGLETADGKALKLNTASPPFTLNNDSVTLSLKGYVAATPDAIVHRTLTEGPFTASATFVIAYP